MSDLPVCSVSYPDCGACGLPTDHDGDSFYCPRCDLDYGDGADGNEATFRDEEADPCGKPCVSTWHGPHKIRWGYGYICQPCALPETHEDECWTPCAIIAIPTEER